MIPKVKIVSIVRAERDTIQKTPPPPSMGKSFPIQTFPEKIAGWYLLCIGTRVLSRIVVVCTIVNKMKTTIVKPSSVIGKIYCKYEARGFYKLSLIIDEEVMEEKRWHLGNYSIVSDALTAYDILYAFGLVKPNVYKIYQSKHLSIGSLVCQCKDFDVELWEDAIVRWVWKPWFGWRVLHFCNTFAVRFCFWVPNKLQQQWKQIVKSLSMKFITWDVIMAVCHITRSTMNSSTKRTLWSRTGVCGETVLFNQKLDNLSLFLMH